MSDPVLLKCPHCGFIASGQREGVVIRTLATHLVLVHRREAASGEPARAWLAVHAQHPQERVRR